MVHAVDDRGVDVLAGGSRDHDFLRAGLQVRARLLLGREQTRALENDIDAERLPRQLRGVAFGANLDAIAVDHERVAVDADLERKRTVRGVMAREMSIRLRIAEIVHCDDRELAPPAAFVKRAKNVSANAAVAIDSDLDGHCVPP